MTTSDHLRILMLEDREDDKELILAVLGRSGIGFQHRWVETQTDFLDQLSAYHPDIVLSDYGLIGYDGLTAHADMRSAGHQQPFIMVTGSLPDDVAVECLKSGMDDYVLKDRMSRLPEAIAQVMEKRRLQAEKRNADQSLLDSQRRLEAAERLARIGNWEWEVATGKVKWSDQMYEIFNMIPGQYTPSMDSFSELIHPDDRNDAAAMVGGIIAGADSSSDGNIRILCADGETKMTHCIYQSNGETVASGRMVLFGTMQDITLQHLTQKALKDLTAELEQRVSDRTRELQAANRLLEIRNQEMVDSINYAQMLQRAILSDDLRFQVHFRDSFILLRPKDIVSGDFYWLSVQGDQTYVAAVDCTGHGVPGALMSVLAQQLLNSIVHDGIREPSDILIELDWRLKENLKGSQKVEMKDGMDLALCRIDRSNGQVCFAGAVRPLFVYQDGVVHEVAGSRMAIGANRRSEYEQGFSQTCITCLKGSTIYLTSDGIYSQFGGPFGKKLMKSRFKDILAEAGALPIEKQQALISARLAAWQGNTDQVDDIIVLGIQF